MRRRDTSHYIAMVSTNTQDAQGKALSLQDVILMVSSIGLIVVYFLSYYCFLRAPNCHALPVGTVATLLTPDRFYCFPLIVGLRKEAHARM